MDGLEILSQFFNKAGKDTRIGVRHIGLYVTLFQLASEQGFDKPLLTFSSKVMKVAKISSTATYYRLLRDLNAFGYIFYRPSFYKGRGSEIQLAVAFSL